MENNNVTLDETEQMILDSGYVDSHRLWRRWILAQICRSWALKPGDPIPSPKRMMDWFCFNLLSRIMPYAWRTLLQELKALSNMQGKEQQKRARFFNFDTVLAMLDEFLTLLDEHVSLYHGGKEAYDRDMPHTADKVRRETARTRALIEKAKAKGSYKNAYRALRTFYNNYLVLWLRGGEYKCYQNANAYVPWVHAYTCAGAYYAMDNLIKFHGCLMTDENGTSSGDMKSSLEKLEQLADRCAADKELCPPNDYPYCARLSRGAEAMFFCMADLMHANGFRPDSIHTN